ncbi:MAG: ribose 5-phosphate isomerase B [Flavobacteriaceae bacterium]|jgi:ribose 5-phosphate isomerase B|nr:ribose 5-phosphate isomerase B [Flavobacteriaceae bacterium]
MNISIGNDHAGTDYKFKIVEYLKSKNIEVTNHGTNTDSSVDYPDFVHPVAKDVESQKSTYGILICGTANGVAMTANKYSSIRAGICWTNEIVSLIRQHNNANILCIPARFTEIEEVLEMIDTFLNTEFEGGRHQNRINKIQIC